VATNRKQLQTEQQLEAEIQADIRKVLGNPREYPDVGLFRNNVGVAETSHGTKIRFGLLKGSADLVGIFTRKDGVGQFIAAEIKTPMGRQSEEQVMWEREVIARGGSYVVLRSVEDARAWIDELRNAPDLDWKFNPEDVA
jgi:hypothetical protein